MKRLRHPIRAIREPFGTAGLIVAMIALVAALGGTALAAAKLNSTQKKEVEKIAKKFAGKPGTNGTNGSNGTAGTKGDAGAAGAPGSPGTAGTNGTSVTSKTLPTGNAKCKSGGSEFTSVSGATFACNGTTGFTKTLPPNETETGTWVLPESSSTGSVAISFAIPLAAELTSSSVACGEGGAPITAACQVHFINGAGKEVNVEEEEVTPLPQCPGSAAEPKAAPGNLCVYAKAGTNTTATDEYFRNPGTPSGGSSVAGTTLVIVNGSFPLGTWAVTAE